MDYENPVEALIPGVQGRVLTVLARTEVELTMRSVAEVAEVSANQATVVLNRLVRLGLVERRNVGAAALVRLVRENEAARSVLSLVNLRQGVLARFEGEARKIRPAPTCLAVFGSFARGEAHENSDVDVLAVPPHRCSVRRWPLDGCARPLVRPGGSDCRQSGQSSPSHRGGVTDAGPSRARALADHCRGGGRADRRLSVGVAGCAVTAARRTQTRPALEC